MDVSWDCWRASPAVTRLYIPDKTPALGEISGGIALRNVIRSKSLSLILAPSWEMLAQENRTYSRALSISRMVFPRALCVCTCSPHGRTTVNRRNVRFVEFHGTHSESLLMRASFNESVIYFRAAAERRRHIICPRARARAGLIFPTMARSECKHTLGATIRTPSSEESDSLRRVDEDLARVELVAQHRRQCGDSSRFPITPKGCV